MAIGLDDQDSNADPLDPTKEIRLHLPLQTHLLLHQLKIVHNQSIHDAIVAALRLYFQRHPVGLGVEV